MLIAMFMIREATMMPRLVHKVAMVTFFSSSAPMTMAAAGIRMAEQMALTTPSQIDVMKSLRLSSPQKAKNFFSVLSITPPPHRP